MSMLELRNISYEVRNKDSRRIILKNISLDVESHSFTVITGPNGSGKSTLLKLIMGMEHPSEGSILFEGRDITGWDVTERAKAGIGFAFQQPVRFKGLVVKDLISLAAGKELSLDEACAYLSEVGLCAKEYVSRELNASLSGGELKRIEIAMLMARQTKLSLFDEPEAGIDLWSFHNLIQVFQKMKGITQGAVVIISHQERILEIADTVVVLKGGEVTETGTRENVLPGLMSGTGGCAYHEGRQVF